jgi:hypothetical protein
MLQCYEQDILLGGGGAPVLNKFAVSLAVQLSIWVVDIEVMADVQEVLYLHWLKLRMEYSVSLDFLLSAFELAALTLLWRKMELPL